MFTNDIPVAEQIKLLRLPTPEVIKSPAFEVIYEALWAKFISFNPDYQFRLESDPVVQVIQAWAYERMMINADINFGARQSLLAFAEGAFLDHLGARLNVTRMVMSPAYPDAEPPIVAVMESDSRFRDRIQLAIASEGKRGGREYYRYWAMTSDPRVLDAIVFSPDYSNGFNMGGQVMICILSSEEGFVASTGLVATVKAFLNGDTIKTLNDILIVEGAIPKIINVAGQVMLNRTAQFSVFSGLEAKLRTKFIDKQRLGSDITNAWVSGTLYQEGVHSINLTSADVVIAFNEFPVLGAVALTFGGYSDQDGYNVDAVEKARAIRFIHQGYQDYAIASHLTQAQIMNDLAYKPRTGIYEPTVVSMAEYLGIAAIRNAAGNLLPEDEIAFLVWHNLSAKYV